MKRILSFYFGLVSLAFLITMPVSAQPTAFGYQGSLNTSGTPANGNHDFEFAMFNGGGVQIGATLTRLNVPVTNAIFAVELDFGNQFQGADRFLEIRVRPSGGGAFTTLTPRQLLTSTPHAIRSLDAAQLGGVAASQYQLANAAVVNAATQYNIGGFRVLSASGVNTFMGIRAGEVNTGNFNSFFGHSAGENNTAGNFNNFFGVGAGQLNSTGFDNSFFGTAAGGQNTTGSDNSFFGHRAGIQNTTGFRNAFFGHNAGAGNTIGNNNSFFGRESGLNNTTGNHNAFFGFSAGQANTTGGFNAFFGSLAGASSTTANFNAFFGNQAGESNTTGINNTFVGALAGHQVTNSTSNSFFGAFAGRNTTTSSNSFFGSTAGMDNTTGSGNSFFGASAGLNNTTATDNSFFGLRAGRLNTTGNNNSFFGSFAGEVNSTANDNSFFGSFAGAVNTTGTSNAFFGKDTGRANTVGVGNSFFGTSAGTANTTASNNSFFGRSAGATTTTGANNAYFGASAGLLSTTGQNNSFFGNNAGLDNTNGSNNAFFGATAGDNNTTGSSNSVFGFSAGDGNTTGTSNSYFGANSDSSDGLTNATAIGSRAFVGSSNSLILGSINGVNGAAANTRVGIGTTAPINRLTIGEPETPILNGAIGIFNAGGTFMTVRDTTNDIEGFVGADSSGVLFGSLTNSIVRIRTGNTNRLTFDSSGNAIFSGIVNMDSFTAVNALDTGGATPICRNAVNRLSTCSSSQRYKSNVMGFSSGLSVIKRLRPVSFNWKDGGMLDLGLVAEEVAAIEPLLTTTNVKGQVEGVKYDRVGVVLVNAVNEQQIQIEAQAELIKRQQQQIDALTKLVCISNPKAEICKEEE